MPSKPMPPELDEDFVDDPDDEESEEDEQFPIPQALLDAAGIESDEDYEDIPEVRPNIAPLARLKRSRKA